MPSRLLLLSVLLSSLAVTAEAQEPGASSAAAGQVMTRPQPAANNQLPPRLGLHRGAASPATAATSLPAAGLPDRVLFDTDADGRLWALGHTWKASFDGLGFAYIPFFGSEAPRNFPLRIELLSARVGGEALTLRQARPVVVGSQVRVARGALTEVLDLGLQQVEQSFVFEALPARGAVAVEVSLVGEYTAQVIGEGLVFANAHGSIGYTKALARDARGQQLPLAIEWSDGRARIEIPAEFVAQAELPLVLDPLLVTNPGIAPGFANTRAQRSPDVASVGGNQATCVVWSRSWSATDEDLVAQLFDINLQPLAASVYLDFTAQSWYLPRVAPNNHSQSFLCVAEVTSGAETWIGGRLLSSAGVVGTPLTIERAGTPGHFGGRSYRPEIGGDPYTFPGNTAAFYTVLFEHEPAAGNRDIYFKQVNQDGSLRHVTGQALHTTAVDQLRPAIGVCNGPGTLSNRMLVAWESQRSASPFVSDIWGAYVEWNGNVLIPAFRITSAPRNERAPAVSSVANLGGSDYVLLAYEEDFGSDNDIMLRVLDMSGTIRAQMNLCSAMGGGAFLLRNQVAPSVDSDGTRFVVTFSEYSGTDFDTYAVTLSFLPGNSTLRIDEDRVPLGASPGVEEYGSTVFAHYGGSSLPATRNEYVIAGVNFASNDIELRRYGGYAAGAAFVPYPTQCGPLGIAAAGVPALGNTVTFTLATAWWQWFSGFVFGFPTLAGLGVCPCNLGVTSVANVGGPVHSWAIPRDPNLVGVTLSIQGFAINGSACLGSIDLSDTIDFTIR